ncbi:MAG: hypothetical protein WCG80_13935 [Spirochaetales bacterium]
MKLRPLALLLPMLLLAGCYTTPSALKNLDTVAFGQEFAVTGKVKPLLQVPLTDINLYLLSDDGASFPLVSKKKFSNGQTVDLHVSVVGTKGQLPNELVDSIKNLADLLLRKGLVPKETAELVSTAIVTTVKGAAALVGNVLILVQG